MPAERCPRCGTARTAGSCACAATSAVEDTAVLPHLEGPPLVRPYVAGAAVVEPGDPAVDPFATRIAPPPVQPIAPPPVAAPPAGPPIAVPVSAQPPAVQPIVGPAGAPPPPPQPPRVPQSASPFGPPQAAATEQQPSVPPQFAPPQQQPQQQPPQQQPSQQSPQQQPSQPDAAATQLLPPVPPAPGRFVPTGAPEPGDATFVLGRVSPQPAPQAPPQPPPAGPAPVEATALINLTDLTDPDSPAEEWPREPGADLGMFTFREDGADAPVSRAGRREQRRQSADRKRLVIAGGAVGVTALGATLAMLLSSASSSVDNALPAPTGPAVSSSVEVSPDPSEPGPSASPDPSGQSASPSRTTARPTQAVTSKAAVAPVTTVPAAPSPSAAPSTSAPVSPPPVKVLKFGDTGPEVTQMQQALMAYRCNRIGPLTMDRTRTNQLGFGDWTRQVLSGVQQDLFGNTKPKPYQDGVYDAATQAALRQTPQGPDC